MGQSTSERHGKHSTEEKRKEDRGSGGGGR